MIRYSRSLFFASALVLIAGFAHSQTIAPNFQDVSQTGPEASFYPFITIAANLGIAVPASLGPCIKPVAGNPPVQPPPGTSAPTSCPYFKPDDNITRTEMAYWIIKSIANEAQITNFLCATGGDPSGIGCGGGILGSSFGDLGAGGSLIQNPFIGVSNAQLMRYIEVMARRGYSKGCGQDNDARTAFCPNAPVTRAQMAVFVIRAKMDNVFPTSLSGITVFPPYGDNFSAPTTPYFQDVQPTDPTWGPYFTYIQKMRELGITSGTSATTYSPGNNVTRKEAATFAIKGFFF